MSDERINSIKTSNYGITLYLRYYDITKIRVKFDGGCLKKDQAATHGAVVNICIVYGITDNFNVSSYPTLENCLFGAVNLTKNADFENYKCYGYGIGFGRHGSFSFPGTGLGRNIFIFGVDMSSSTKIDHRKKGYYRKKTKKFVWACIIIEKIVTYLLMAPTSMKRVV